MVVDTLLYWQRKQRVSYEDHTITDRCSSPQCKLKPLCAKFKMPCNNLSLLLLPCNMLLTNYTAVHCKSAMPHMLHRPHLHSEHWALQHEAMEALLAYMRLSEAGDFKRLLPRSLHNPGMLLGTATQRCRASSKMLLSGLKRVHCCSWFEPGACKIHLATSALRQALVMHVHFALNIDAGNTTGHVYSRPVPDE